MPPVSETPSRPPKFLDRLRAALPMRGQPLECVTASVSWTASFIRFPSQRQPRDLGRPEMGPFLESLAPTEKDPVRAGPASASPWP